ncbi:MAG TPA: hypothetical protein VNO52_16830 [Methylomirabilota bacterium]|nr:hypothetical protein [Methylomirabilota bacterium]
MGQSVRIWQKKKLIFTELSFRHQDMVKIGTVGVAAVKNRLAAAQGPEDAPAKPLTKRYAIFKTRLGKGNRRNLRLTGGMLDNFMLRTVTENSAKAALTSRKERIKGGANQKIEPWVVLSPKNQAAVKEAVRRVLMEAKKRLLVEGWLGGRQI